MRRRRRKIALLVLAGTEPDLGVPILAGWVAGSSR
jgi:hypothetical protein